MNHRIRPHRVTEHLQVPATPTDPGRPEPKPGFGPGSRTIRRGWAAAGALLAAAAAAGLGWLPDLPCGFRLLTGAPCPFCGLTRSLEAAYAGDLAAAALGYPLLPFAFICGVLLTAWRAAPRPWGRRLAAYPLARRIRNRPEVAWAAAGCLLSANWIYRMALGMD